MATIQAPKFLTASELPNFLKVLEYVFEKKKDERDFKFDLSNVKKTSILGALIIYKVIEYTFINKRFSNPEIETDHLGNIEKDLMKFGFWDLIKNYVLHADPSKEYTKLKFVFQDNFFLAPQALLRGDIYTTTALREKVLPKIEEYYSNPKASTMIFTCLSEILLNFWEHAVEDTKSVIVARGSHANIEIACADTAKGIISTLKPVLGQTSMAEDIIARSVEMGVTSKKNTNHMGYGLWILNQIVTLAKGRLHLYSEGYMYRNEGGAVSIKKTGFWKGTIIYISLGIRNPITISDLPEYKDEFRFAHLKIDFK